MKKTGIFHLMAVVACIFTNAMSDDSVTAPQGDAAGQKYFEICSGPAKVLRYLNPQSPILGMANKNEIYPLVFKGTTWYKIAFKGDTGWIEGIQGRIVDSPVVAGQKIPKIIIFILIGICSVLLVVLGGLFIYFRFKRQKFRKISLKRDVLIISSAEKEIKYSLTDSQTTLSKCFSEIGFKINTVRDLDHVRPLLSHYAPDILVVDWKIEKNIQSSIMSILSMKGAISSILIIFFNVPDAVGLGKRNKLPFVHFLGIVFSDRDLFKIVTPLILKGETKHTFKKSVQSAALEGEIGSGNLAEVMQFIDIGRKTGCLYITGRNPLGIIYFEQGRISYAATRAAMGKAAVSEILNLREGRFRFAIDKTTAKKNVDLSTLEVLMDWTKGKDEALRH